jgi:hypothetical protein
MQKCISTGLSLPRELFNIVESRQGDISRSKYLLIIIEKTLQEVNEGKDSSLGRSNPQTHNTGADTSGTNSSQECQLMENVDLNGNYKKAK